MKKVLSVLLAAAMVMGMSVSAFAIGTDANGNQVWGEASTNVDVTDTKVQDLSFGTNMIVVRNGYSFEVNATNNVVEKSTDEDEVRNGSAFAGFEPGDDLYFRIYKNQDHYAGNIDKDWNINIKANDYVAAAKFYCPETGDDQPWSDNTFAGTYKFVKVEIKDDLDELSTQKVNFYMYLADNTTKKQSAKATVKYSFDNVTEKYVDFDFSNDADHAAKWIVAEGKKGRAVFDFNDNCYFTVNMVPEEEVILNLSTAYDKDIDKEYNEYDADLSFYNFKGDSDSFTKKGELFIPSAKDNKFIYEVVDGELVEVDAEYDSAYKVANVGTKKGYVIETKELGYYVVADEELVVEEAEDNTNSSTSTDKTNPETGANDFVGAAVALAVVSVAAAGALAFKK